MKEPHIGIISAFWKLTHDLNWPGLVKRQRLNCKVGEQVENENCKQVGFVFCSVLVTENISWRLFTDDSRYVKLLSTLGLKCVFLNFSNCMRLI